VYDALVSTMKAGWVFGLFSLQLDAVTDLLLLILITFKYNWELGLATNIPTRKSTPLTFSGVNN
jgi:hypothetical protein